MRNDESDSGTRTKGDGENRNRSEIDDSRGGEIEERVRRVQVLVSDVDER